MTNLDIDFLMEAEHSPWQPSSISLSDVDIDRIIQACQTISDPEQQRQACLQLMALEGFKQWANDGIFDLTVNYDTDNLLSNGVNCYASNTRLYVVAETLLIDDAVSIPISAVDSADHADLYVIAEVEDEIGRVTIHNALRYEQLQGYRQQQNLKIEESNFYSVPLSYFDVVPERVIFHLVSSQTAVEPTTNPGLSKWRQKATQTINHFLDQLRDKSDAWQVPQRQMQVAFMGGLHPINSAVGISNMPDAVRKRINELYARQSDLTQVTPPQGLDDPISYLVYFIHHTRDEEVRVQAAELLWILDPEHPEAGVR